MDENIEKIRRNLIISSLVMFLMLFANITIPKKIDLFGTGISVESPEYLNLFIFGIGIYFLIRFTHSIKHNDFQFEELFLKSSLNEMGKFIKPTFQQYENDYYEHRRFSDDELPEKKLKNILFSKEYQMNLPKNLGAQINRRSWVEYEWSWERMTDEEDSMAQAVCTQTLIIPKSIVFKSYAIALIRTLLSKNVFEVYLPLVFGTITLIIFAYYKFYEGFDFFGNIFL